MKRATRHPLVISSWLILFVLCLSLWPQPTAALRSVDILADDNFSFTKGKFFRTGLANESVGGVQLIPVKVQKTWGTAASLPKHLSSHTSAVYRNRMFVVGGKTYASDGIGVTKSASVYATRIANLQTGELEPWAELPALPLPLSDSASTIVEVNGQPYLFVLGGQRQMGVNLDDVTTSRIFYYPIREDANGNLITTQWYEITDQAQRLPHDTLADESNNVYRGGGVSRLAVISVNRQGTPYIYTFGGFNRIHASAGGYTNRYHSAVYRATVSGSNDNLTLTWSETPISHITNGANQIAIAGAAHVTFTHPETNDLGVYLIGGTRCTGACTTSPVEQDDSSAYVARIDNTGALHWLSAGNMSAGRSAHDAIQANGQIVVSAGRANGDPSTTLAQGFIGSTEHDLGLYKDPAFPHDPSFDLQDGALNAQARMTHTMETLPAGQHGDWMYIIGGQVEVNQGTITHASDQVLIGNLITPPVQNEDSFVANGKYYSDVYDYGSNARFFTFYWKAILNGNQQMTMQYRIGNNREALGNFSAPVPSTNGLNSIPLPSGETYRYIQFAVTLTRDSQNLKASPVLDSVSVDVDSNRFPNVRLAPDNGFSVSPNPVSSDASITPLVRIANMPYTTSNGNTIRTVAANWNGEGYLYVDLYITYGGPASAPAPAPARPQLGQEGQVYAIVNKASLPANAEYTIPTNRALQPGTTNAADKYTWRPSTCSEAPCPLVEWHNLFTQPGLYYIWVMVDSLDPVTFNHPNTSQVTKDFGNIVESDQAGTDGETDNFQMITVTVNSTRPRLLLPAIPRGGASGSSVQSETVPQPREQLDR
jgi:hypothetical protein